MRVMKRFFFYRKMRKLKKLKKAVAVILMVTIAAAMPVSAVEAASYAQYPQYQMFNGRPAHYRGGKRGDGLCNNTYRKYERTLAIYYSISGKGCGSHALYTYTVLCTSCGATIRTYEEYECAGVHTEHGKLDCSHMGIVY